MAGPDEVRLKYTAEISDLRKKLASIPDITGAEARKMVRELNKGVKAVEKSQGRVAKSAQKQAKSQADAMAATRRSALMVSAALVAVGTAWLRMQQSVADSVNVLNDASIKTGIAAETLAALDLAAKGSGQTLDQLIPSLQQFPKRMADTARGTGDAKIAFERLGVAVVDSTGELRSADDVLKDTIRALQAVKNPTERAALATQAFGRSGGALMQALGDNGDLDDFIRLADEFGVDVGPEASKAADDWQRSMASLKGIIAGTAQELSSGFGDGSTILDNFTESIIVFRAIWRNAMEGITSDLQAFIAPLESLSKGDFEDALRGFLKAESGFLNLAEIGQGFADSMTDAKTSILEFRKVSEGLGGGGIGAPEPEPEPDPKKRKKSIDDLSKATATLRKITAAANSDQLSAEEKILAQANEQIDAITKLDFEKQGLAGTIAAITAVEERADRDLFDLRMERIEAERVAQMKALSESSDAAEAAAKQTEDNAERRHQDKLARTRTEHESLASIAGSTAEAFELMAERKEKAGKDGAMGFLVAAKLAAVAEIGLNFAIGLSAAAIPPMAGFKTAAVVATNVLALGKLASTSIPSFHRGGVIDERQINTLSGESVLNRQATESLGASGVDALNSGAPAPGGGSWSLRIGRLEAREIIRTDVRSGGLVTQTAKRASRNSGRAGVSGRGVRS